MLLVTLMMIPWKVGISELHDNILECWVFLQDYLSSADLYQMIVFQKKVS